MGKVQWGQYKLKNQVLCIYVGCLTDPLDQSSGYVKMNHELFKKTIISQLQNRS